MMIIFSCNSKLVYIMPCESYLANCRKVDAMENGHGKVLPIHLKEFEYLLILLSVLINVRDHFYLTENEFLLALSFTC